MEKTLFLNFPENLSGKFTNETLTTSYDWLQNLKPHDKVIVSNPTSYDDYNVVSHVTRTSKLYITVDAIRYRKYNGTAIKDNTVLIQYSSEKEKQIIHRNKVKSLVRYINSINFYKIPEQKILQIYKILKDNSNAD